MKLQSNSRQPHDPHALYLDEDISGNAFASLLTQARILVHQYEKLLRKNRKIPDAHVIAATSKANFVLVTTDKKMEAEWTEDIITHKAKVIRLTDDAGGPIHWASALVCGQSSWVRALLDHPSEPLILRINRNGVISKIIGEAELRERRDQLLTSRIIRAKRHVSIEPHGSLRKPAYKT